MAEHFVWSGHSENEQGQISLAYLVPTPRWTRSALGIRR
jgi:hypothetical protein